MRVRINSYPARLACIYLSVSPRSLKPELVERVPRVFTRATSTRAGSMPYRHTLIFDDSLNMLWKDYADRAVVDYRYNSSVKGSAQGCAAAMRVDLQARLVAHI